MTPTIKPKFIFCFFFEDTYPPSLINTPSKVTPTPEFTMSPKPLPTIATISEATLYFIGQTSYSPVVVTEETITVDPSASESRSTLEM